MLLRDRRLRIFVGVILVVGSALGTTGGSSTAQAAGVAVGPAPLPGSPVSLRPVPSGRQIGRPDRSPVPRPPLPPVSLLKVRPPNVPLPPPTNFGTPGVPGPRPGQAWSHGTPRVPPIPVAGRVKPAYATGPSCNNVSPCGPLNFGNGRVEHHPLVYLIFWGPTWTTNSAEQAAQAAQQQLFGQLAGTPYDRILGQYPDTHDFPHDDIRVAGIWVDTQVPTPTVNTMTAGQESVRATLVNGWANTPDTDFIVYPQDGTQYDNTDCGAHGEYNNAQTFYYAAYVGYNRPGCGNGSIANNMTNTASHEFFEMVTDPDTKSGYRTPPNQDPKGNGLEVGDLCNSNAYDFFGVQIQAEFDNASGACRIAADGGTTYPSNYRLADK